MSESLREAYRKKGFVVIRGGVDTHVLDALRSESDGLRALLAERQRAHPTVWALEWFRRCYQR